MTFWGLSAEYLFIEILRGHYRSGWATVRRDQMTEVVRARLLDQKWLFEDAYSRFFFLDTQPDNADRFKLSLEDCLPTDSHR